MFETFIFIFLKCSAAQIWAQILVFLRFLLRPFTFAAVFWGAATMERDAGTKPEKVRKSALRKSGSGDKPKSSSKQGKDTAKSLMKAEKADQKKKATKTSKELRAEVLKRATAANSKARHSSSTTSSSSKKDKDKSQKIEKPKENKGSQATKKEKKEKKEKKVRKDNKILKKEKKGSKEKDSKKEKEEVTPSPKAALLQKALSKESTPPPVTPPAKRLRMKSPAGSQATDASTDHYAGKKERAAAAMHERLYEKLEEAVDDAELHAEMDAAGMLDLLEDLKSKAKGSETAEADALKKSQQEPNNEEQVQVAEELEALSPGSADTDEILGTLGVSSEEEGDEEGEDDNESQEEEDEGAEEETEDEAASDPEDDDDDEDGKGDADEDEAERGNEHDGGEETDSEDSTSEAEETEAPEVIDQDKVTEESSTKKADQEDKETQGQSTALVAAVAKTGESNTEKVRNSFWVALDLGRIYNRFACQHFY